MSCKYTWRHSFPSNICIIVYRRKTQMGELKSVCPRNPLGLLLQQGHVVHAFLADNLRQLSQKMVCSSVMEESGEKARAWKIIWSGSVPARRAIRMSTSLVSWFSAFFTACLFGGLDLFSQGKVSLLFIGTPSKTTWWIFFNLIGGYPLYPLWENNSAQKSLVPPLRGCALITQSLLGVPRDPSPPM